MPVVENESEEIASPLNSNAQKKLTEADVGSLDSSFDEISQLYANTDKDKVYLINTPPPEFYKGDIIRLRKSGTPREERSYRVVVVGNSNVGKTSLLMRACRGTVKRKVQSTIGKYNINCRTKKNL